MATLVPTDRDLKTCPYNHHHKVKSSRFHLHLSQCARQNPHIRLKTCPFNNTHRLRDEEFEAHVTLCPDGRQTIRALVELKTERAKTATEDTNNNEDKDEWADEYIEPGKMTTFNYDILAEDDITAEWLFDKRFGDKRDKTFTDTIYIQKMTYEERKKYQKMCVDRIKETRQRRGASEVKEEEEEEVEEEEEGDRDGDDWSDESGRRSRSPNNRSRAPVETANDAIRMPTSRPIFKTVRIGIGRGRARGQPSK